MKAELNKLENQLLKKYKDLYHNTKPTGVFDIAPAIPFIGNDLKSPRVLVYASAENLTYLNNKSNKKTGDINLRSLGQKQYIRSRIFYNEYKERKAFPHVHIQPINDGSLLSVARYILKKLNKDIELINNPYEFIESIAVANFGKFSIYLEKNKDYANIYDKLKISLEYVAQDFRLIEPEILIIPKTIYDTVKNKDAWKEIMAEAGKSIKTVILIYQANITVINTHITKQIEGMDYYKYIDMPETAWPVKLNMEKYFCWLDKNWGHLLIDL